MLLTNMNSLNGKKIACWYRKIYRRERRMTKLQKMLTEIIQKAVREEFKQLKAQLLNEMKTPQAKPNNLVEVQKNFRKNLVFEQPKRGIKYSNDPMLNSILSECEPISEQQDIASRLGYIDEQTPIVVTSGLDGSRPNISNPGVKGVMEAMNRDYSGMFKSQPNSAVKSKIFAMIADDSDMGHSSGDDEDMSWLNKVG
jgi:hypothetical protein